MHKLCTYRLVHLIVMHSIIFYVARVTLTAADPITITDERSAIAHEGFRVVIYCSGSGDKMWQSSAGEDIIVETAITSSRNLYQRSDPINNKQILFIQSFSLEDSAIYTCTTDLSVDGSSIAASVFITSGMKIILSNL